MHSNNQFIIRWLAIAGIAGGILMLTGDMLYYFQISSGQNFHAIKSMGNMPVWRLTLGGAIGPIAGILYGLGVVSFYFALKQHSVKIAAVMCTCLIIMFLNGGAYHAVYATYGFAEKITDPAISRQMIGNIKMLHNVMYDISFVTGIAGTVLFFYLVLFKKTIYPKWIVIIFPTLLSLLESIALLIPYPVGGIISGGWTNGLFTIFFIVSAKILWNMPFPQP